MYITNKKQWEAIKNDSDKIKKKSEASKKYYEKNKEYYQSEEHKKKKVKWHKNYYERNKEKILEKKRNEYKNNESNKECKICGTPFFTFLSTSKFCSRKCFHEDSKTKR